MSTISRSIASFCLSIFLVLCPIRLAAQAGHDAHFEGGKVHYVTYGSGSPTIVLVHGWNCDGWFWQDQIAALSAHWPLLIVDLPGFGKSDKPHVDYTPAFFARGLSAAMDDAHITRAYLVGHSMGGTVVRQYAADHPEKVAALVIVDSRTLLQGEGLSMPLPQRQQFVKDLSGPHPKDAETDAIEKMFSFQTPPELEKKITERMLAANTYVAASSMQGLLAPIVWTKKPTAIPTLGIYRTPLAPEAIDALHTMFQNFQLILFPGAGHFLMMERPEEFNAKVTGFLLAQDRAHTAASTP